MTGAAARTASFAVAFLVVYAAAVLTPAGQRLDAESLGAFAWLPSAARAAAGPVRTVLAVAAGALAVVTVLWLLLRRRAIAAVRVAVAIGAATAGGELLKQLILPRPQLGDFGYADNTLPSVHVAFVTVAFLAALRVLPDAWRPARFAWIVFLAAFVAALAAPVSFAHRAGDALAGLLLVGVVDVLLPAARRPRAGRWAEHPFTRSVGIVAALAAAAGVVTIGLAVHSGAPAVLGAALVLLFAAASAWVVLARRGGI